MHDAHSPAPCDPVAAPLPAWSPTARRARNRGRPPAPTIVDGATAAAARQGRRRFVGQSISEDCRAGQVAAGARGVPITDRAGGDQD